MIHEANFAVVVTGAAHGIGRGIARLLASRGWRVIGVDADAVGLERLIAEIGEAHVSLRGDVSDEETLERAAAYANAHGILRGWVNNAATFPTGPLEDLERQSVVRVTQVNFIATVQGCVIAARSMISSGVQGSIVNMSSIQARHVHPGMALYGATKAAIDGLTYGAAVDLGGYGIRVNSVAPGEIWTERTGASQPHDAVTAARAAADTQQPMGRVGSPNEIAEVVAFLLSDEASYITGAVIPVDGGRGALLPGGP